MRRQYACTCEVQSSSKSKRRPSASSSMSSMPHCAASPLRRGSTTQQMPNCPGNRSAQSFPATGVSPRITTQSLPQYPSLASSPTLQPPVYHLGPAYPPTMSMSSITTAYRIASPHVPNPILPESNIGPMHMSASDSIMQYGSCYGLPKYPKVVKPDYRRFCYSVGKAEKPYAALPGGPLWGMPTCMSSQLV